MAKKIIIVEALKTPYLNKVLNINAIEINLNQKQDFTLNDFNDVIEEIFSNYCWPEDIIQPLITKIDTSNITFPLKNLFSQQLLQIKYDVYLATGEILKNMVLEIYPKWIC